MAHTIREALLAMNYSEVQPSIWLKPIGQHAFTYSEKSGKWSNYFMDISDKLCLWESHSFKDGDPLPELKNFESYTRVDIVCGKNSSQFHLKAIDF
jgi:hypothetical protein